MGEVEMNSTSYSRAVAAATGRGFKSHQPDVNSGDFRKAHREFDSKKHRAFIDRTVQALLDQLSALLALGREETFSGATTARFQGSVLTQGSKLKDKRAQVARLLQAAFPESSFQLEFRGDEATMTTPTLIFIRHGQVGSRQFRCGDELPPGLNPARSH
jgi:hypothetical protein